MDGVETPAPLLIPRTKHIQEVAVKNLALVLVLLLVLRSAEAVAQRGPVIDVHLHSYVDVAAGVRAAWADRSDAQALTSPESAEEHMRATLSEMDRYNVVLAVVSGPEASIRAWQEAAPGRFIGGISSVPRRS